MWNEFSSFVKSLLARAAVLRGEEGQGLVEYALIVALVSVVAIAVLTGLGADVVSKLAQVTSAL
jgi:pilus assembly protein Flp/PilA